MRLDSRTFGRFLRTSLELDECLGSFTSAAPGFDGGILCHREGLFRLVGSDSLRGLS